MVASLITCLALMLGSCAAGVVLGRSAAHVSFIFPFVVRVDTDALAIVGAPESMPLELALMRQLWLSWFQLGRYNWVVL